MVTFRFNFFLLVRSRKGDCLRAAQYAILLKSLEYQKKHEAKLVSLWHDLSHIKEMPNGSSVLVAIYFVKLQGANF